MDIKKRAADPWGGSPFCVCDMLFCSLDLSGFFRVRTPFVLTRLRVGEHPHQEDDADGQTGTIEEDGQPRVRLLEHAAYRTQ